MKRPADGNGSWRSLDRVGSSLLLVIIVTTVLLHRVTVGTGDTSGSTSVPASQPLAAAPNHHASLSVPPTRVDPSTPVPQR